MAHGARAAATPAPGALAGPHELPVFILTGPTGAGKTDWALGLAERAPVAIASVGSALVYRLPGEDRQRGRDPGLPAPGHRHRQAGPRAACARSPPPDRNLRADRGLFRG